MKKTYIKPQTLVLHVETQRAILATSNESNSLKLNHHATDAEALTKKSGWNSSNWQ